MHSNYSTVHTNRSSSGANNLTWHVNNICAQHVSTWAQYAFTDSRAIATHYRMSDMHWGGLRSNLHNAKWKTQVYNVNLISTLAYQPVGGSKAQMCVGKSTVLEENWTLLHECDVSENKGRKSWEKHSQECCVDTQWVNSLKTHRHTHTHTLLFLTSLEYSVYLSN